MKHNIRSARGRTTLPVRVEPYWTQLGDAIGLGVYVGKSGQTWKARAPGHKDGPRWRKATLGSCESLSYADAAAIARDWAGPSKKPVISTVTVGSACEAWLTGKRSKAGGIVSDRTAQGWINCTRRVSRYFGADTPLHRITTKQCEAFRDHGKRSASGGDRELASALAIFNSAADYDGVKGWAGAQKHGANRIAIERADDESGQRRALSLDEVKAIINAADEPSFADFLHVMFATAQRPQALRMADCRDFDRETGTLRLRRGKNAGKKGVVTIPLFSDTVDLLTRLTGNRGPNEPLLCDENGKRWSEIFQLRRFPRALASSGVEDVDGVTLYTVRHSAITWMIEVAKLDVMTVATMADTSVELILKHYFRRTERLGRGPSL